MARQRREGHVGRIGESFEVSRAQGGLVLMPFVPAGYPSLSATSAVLEAVAQAGAGVIEVGIPFSDPIADGPVIQEAFTHALARGVRPGDVLEMVRGVRPRIPAAMVAMVSFSIMFRRGARRFSQECAAAGLDGLILPDLPAGEAEKVCGEVRSAGLDTILLAAPSTPVARRQRIAELSSGFVYYLSVAGITGAREQLPEGLIEQVRGLRELTDKPVCVGFGLSRPQHIQALRGHADGAIVGSALVRRIGAAGSGGSAGDPAEAAGVGAAEAGVARAAGEFCRELLGRS